MKSRINPIFIEEEIEEIPQGNWKKIMDAILGFKYYSREEDKKEF